MWTLEMLVNLSTVDAEKALDYLAARLATATDRNEARRITLAIRHAEKNAG